MSIKTMLAIGGAVLVVVSGVAFWRGSIRPKSQRYVLQVAPAENSLPPTSEFQRGLLAVAAQASVAPPPPVPVVAEQPQPSSEPTLSDAEVVHAKLGLLDAEFTSQTLDRNWARDAADGLNSTLRERLNDVAALATITPTDCRGSLCRAELSYADDAQRHTVVSKVFGLPPVWPGEVMGLTERDEASHTTRTVLYFARTGTEFHDIID